MSLAELRSYDNGLWCCADHGRFIDAGGGNGFDAATLKAYRCLAEARAALRQQGSLPPPVGWVHKLHVEEGVPLVGGFDIRFGKNTLISGPNGSGKTMVADMLAGLGKLGRWSRYASGDRRLTFAIDYYDPEPRHIEVVAGPKGSGVSTRVDGGDAIPVQRVAIVHFLCERFRWTDEQQSGLDVLAGTLDEDPNSVRAALVSTRTKGLLGARAAGDDLEFRLPAKPGQPSGTQRESYFPLALLGGTAQPRLAIEAAVALAQYRAASDPTMLIVDDVSGHFDEGWTKHVLELVTDPANPFQTVVITAYTSHWPHLPGWTKVDIREVAGGHGSPRLYEVTQDVPG